MIAKLKEIKNNRWVKFGVVTVLYLLWFVVWTENLLWGLGVIVIYDIYITRYIDKIYLNRYRALKEKSAPFRHVMEWVEALLFAVVVVVPLKIYFFGMYVIPSSSMEQTLMVGDYIYVSKLHYGPKMPNTPLSFPFVQNTMPLTQDTPSYLEWMHWPYKRLAGLDTIKRNDVVVFNFPAGDTVATIEPTANYHDIVRAIGHDAIARQSPIVYRPIDKRENYIKRCVAIAGDSLMVRDGAVYINGVAQQSLPGVQYRYIVSVSEPLTPKVFETLRINPSDMSYNQSMGRYLISLTDEGLAQIKQLANVTEVVRYLNYQPSDATFPHDTELYPWTEDFFGPIWIPRAGVTVPLTLETLPLYERIIRNYEGNTLEIKGDQILVNGEPVEGYTFKMNYYFMMGDNRHNSLDSRFWGFVPEDHVEGRASFVWLSITEGESIFTGMRWSRMFRSIN